MTDNIPSAEEIYCMYCTYKSIIRSIAYDHNNGLLIIIHMHTL